MVAAFHFGPDQTLVKIEDCKRGQEWYRESNISVDISSFAYF